MNKAAFLDRDGVVNRRAPEGAYITRWEEMKFLPGVAEAIALLNQAGLKVIVVSNQRCVAKGLISARDLEQMHRRMCEELAAEGSKVDAVYYCPHELRAACDCRKPKPGMLLEAARTHSLDLAESWMIGDSDIDIEAGRNAGCRTVKLPGKSEASQPAADVGAPSLLHAVHRILRYGTLPKL
jgi:D-glycero-D-manno-heptose 1,7-bisphosphate phosphatase